MSSDADALTGLFSPHRRATGPALTPSMRRRHPTPESGTAAILLDDPLVVAALRRAHRRDDRPPAPREHASHPVEPKTRSVARLRRAAGHLGRWRLGLPLVAALVAGLLVLTAGGHPRSRAQTDTALAAPSGGQPVPRQAVTRRDRRARPRARERRDRPRASRETRRTPRRPRATVADRHRSSVPAPAPAAQAPEPAQPAPMAAQPPAAPTTTTARVPPRGGPSEFAP